jgi:hypothetical protein
MIRVPLPGLAVVIRRERTVGAENTPPHATLRLPVKSSPALAPKPIDDTSFYGYGRDPKHTWPTRDVPELTDIAGISSHMSPWFLFPKVPSAMVVGMPRGAQLPVAGRPNIDSQGSVSYGSLATFRPDPTFSVQYAKLLGG